MRAVGVSEFHNEETSRKREEPHSVVILTTPSFIGVRKNPYPLTNSR